jgi:hypothetical protein
MTTQTDYPVQLEAAYPQQSNRVLALLGLLFFLKSLLLIPHFVVLWFLGILLVIAIFVSYIVVLFTGRYPGGLFDFIVGVTRWQARTSLWLAGITDKYPPFSLR